MLQVCVCVCREIRMSMSNCLCSKTKLAISPVASLDIRGWDQFWTVPQSPLSVPGNSHSHQSLLPQYEHHQPGSWDGHNCLLCKGFQCREHTKSFGTRSVLNSAGKLLHQCEVCWSPNTNPNQCPVILSTGSAQSRLLPPPSSSGSSCLSLFSYYFSAVFCKHGKHVLKI